MVVAALALGVLAVTATGTGGFQPAAPTVERQSLWIAEVDRGEMSREVRGRGMLVPERIEWVTAVTTAQVERTPIEPGTQVSADEVLVELKNPDLELAALEAESELAAARADLANLGATLETQVLAQEGSVATMAAGAADAERTAAANRALSDEDAVARDEVQRTEERAEELATRLRIEKRRLRVLGTSRKAQITAQTAKVKRLQAVARFRNDQLDGLRVRARSAGVLQELPVEIGQWVNPGTILAKVVQPDQLKAELRIPEVLAKDVAIDQAVQVDTHNGEVAGVVSRIDPSVQGGTVTVDVRLSDPLPRGARPDLSVDGVIELERLDDVLRVRRPAQAKADSTLSLFRLTSNDAQAERVSVRLGRSAVSYIEVLEGLEPGDRVIVSDMSAWDAVDRVEID
jgi:multidrug efflux pump subunit AcrA (membrane-fusion protein)